jgi:LPS sulfotransferase NodH
MKQIAAMQRGRARARAASMRLATLQQVLAPSQSITTSYIICTNPRSGSWLLSEGLAATSLVGNPREWFNVLEQRAQACRLGAAAQEEPDFPAYLDHVIANATTPNGVCGIKLHYYQFAYLAQKLATIEAYESLSTARAIAAAFAEPKYVWLTRRDKARQAISYYRACQTEEWWQIDGVSRPEGDHRNIDFNARAIRQLEFTLENNDNGWRQFFRANDIDVLVVDYEDLAADYRGNICRVLQWLGMDGAKRVHIPPPRLKRQSDARTEQWLARYLSSKLELDPAGPGPDPAAGIDSANDPERADDEHAISPLANVSVVDPLSARPSASREGGPPAPPDKPLRLINAFHRLSQLHPHASAIERRPRLSRQEFLESYYVANRPVVIQGLLDDWPVRDLWTPSYLKQRAGDAIVEIMAGRDADPHYELNVHRHRKLVPFSEYIDAVESCGATNDHYLVANNNFFQRPGCDVLLDDLTPFTDILDPALKRGHTFLWYGPAGTVTPLHHDACNILIAQLRGRKQFKVIPATQWPLVYNASSYFSEVDCEWPDYTRWPLFKDATVIDLTLEAGEVLFMPVGWWHFVRTLEITTMVSFTNFVFPNTYDW